MTILWDKVAKAWRKKKEFVDRDDIERTVEENLKAVKTEINQSNQVPSAWDEIFDDENDW